MKIAILGTRGIPNNYGGPETNAESIAPIFVRMKHEVTVYSPDEHPYQESEWQGIRIKHIFNRESRLSIWGTLLYDYLCLRDAVASDFDVILELGYVPCAIFFPLFRKRRARLVTNMDGLEWKRSKWNFVLQQFAELTEALGARYSDALIADNEAIRDYVLKKYGKNSHFIPYGAKPVGDPDAECLKHYRINPLHYCMLIARMEPENNIETILDGYLLSGDSDPFLVIGNTSTKYGHYLLKKFSSKPNIIFLEGIYDYGILSALRWHSKLYFHGHSVGGTNPSLVEAMASNALIAAHDNPFNRSVLESNGLFFSEAGDIARIICSDTLEFRNSCVIKNRAKVEQIYNWEKIAHEHLRVFEEVLSLP
jgi:glycosyltransferase involved in cell wall biosynthesis